MLVLASLPIAIIHQFILCRRAPFLENQLGLLVTYIAPAMTVGQFAEIAVMAILGMFIGDSVSADDCHGALCLFRPLLVLGD
ncbi:MAG: hypothetical protein Ct9H90mP25_1870 [Gammaproteobacteria bacterium]|nr:MAG: hypothetical protein Ct9H90mP25_1870 [Gammaproteobacteria bacterium]